MLTDVTGALRPARRGRRNPQLAEAFQRRTCDCILVFIDHHERNHLERVAVLCDQLDSVWLLDWSVWMSCITQAVIKAGGGGGGGTHAMSRVVYVGSAEIQRRLDACGSSGVNIPRFLKISEQFTPQCWRRFLFGSCYLLR